MTKICQYEIVEHRDDGSSHTTLIEGTSYKAYAVNDVHAVISIFDGNEEIFTIGLNGEKVRVRRVGIKNEIRVIKGNKKKHLESLETNTE